MASHSDGPSERRGRPLGADSLILIAGAMVTLSRDHLAPGSNAIVILVFTLIGISTVAAPVGLYLAGGKKARLLLDRSKTWLTQNNATVTAVMLLVIGGVLLVEGIRDLSA